MGAVHVRADLDADAPAGEPRGGVDPVAGIVVVRLPVALLIGEVDLAVMEDGFAVGAEEERGVVAPARAGIADDRAAEDREAGVPGGRREEAVAGAARLFGVGAGWLRL